MNAAAQCDNRQTRTCACGCGRTFQVGKHQSTRKYASDRCRDKANRPQAPASAQSTIRVCPCGVRFQPVQPNHTYHSEDCRRRLYAAEGKYTKNRPRKPKHTCVICGKPTTRDAVTLQWRKCCSAEHFAEYEALKRG